MAIYISIKNRLKGLNKKLYGRILLFFPFFLYHRFYLLKNRILPGYFYSYLYYYTSKIYTRNDLTIGLKMLGLKNVRFPHPIGIVIGRYVQLGENCIIYQNVTIGAKSIDGYLNKEYPRIGNNVTIGANAVIVGNISIGDNVTIGACAFVNKNIPDNSVVVGNSSIIR